MTQVTIPQSNYAIGRNGKTVKWILCHWMVGTLASTDAVFKNPNSQTSAHYGIEDKVIHQYVAEKNTAYHSGDYTMNLQSIGIEHSAQPGRKASEATYQTSIKLVADICKRYNLDPRKAVRPHSSVVATQCCGTVDWKRIANEAYNLMGNETLTDVEITRLIQTAWGRNPTPAELTAYKQRPALDLYKGVINDAQCRLGDAELQKLAKVSWGRELTSQELTKYRTRRMALHFRGTLTDPQTDAHLNESDGVILSPGKYRVI